MNRRGFFARLFGVGVAAGLGALKVPPVPPAIAPPLVALPPVAPPLDPLPMTECVRLSSTFTLQWYGARESTLATYPIGSSTMPYRAGNATWNSSSTAS